MKMTVNEWVAAFNSGSPLLLQFATDNNPEGITSKLNSSGLPVDSSPEGIFNEICNLSPQITEDEFYQILDVQFIARRNPEMLEVFQVQNGLESKTGIEENVFTFSESFPAGIKALKANIDKAKREGQEIVIQRETPTDNAESLLKDYIKKSEVKERRNERKAIAFFMLGTMLALLFFVVNHFKTVKSGK